METTIDDLLDLVLKEGGKIVPASKCDIEEVLSAESDRRFWRDSDGNEFIYLPPKNKIKHEPLL